MSDRIDSRLLWSRSGRSAGLALSCALALAAAPLAAVTAPEPASRSEDWAEPHVRSLARKGVLEGYPDAARRLRDRILARTEQATREMRKVRGKLGGTEGGK